MRGVDVVDPVRYLKDLRKRDKMEDLLQRLLVPEEGFLVLNIAIAKLSNVLPILGIDA